MISVVLLTDDDPKFRENVYEISQLGFQLYFKFPMVKLLDYRDKWEELEHDSNPFAIVTKAFLKTLETQGNDQERYQWKKHFLLELYRRGMSREMIWALYEFLDIVMALPEVKNEELHEEIKQTTEESKMSILTTAERVGIKKGIEQGIEQGIEKGIEKGIEQGLRGTISDILEIKFGVVGLELLDHVEQITDIETLQKIRAGLKQTQSLAEAEALIRAHARARSEN